MCFFRSLLRSVPAATRVYVVPSWTRCYLRGCTPEALVGTHEAQAFLSRHFDAILHVLRFQCKFTYFSSLFYSVSAEFRLSLRKRWTSCTPQERTAIPSVSSFLTSLCPTARRPRRKFLWSSSYMDAAWTESRQIAYYVSANKSTNAASFWLFRKAREIVTGAPRALGLAAFSTRDMAAVRGRPRPRAVLRIDSPSVRVTLISGNPSMTSSTSRKSFKP